MYRPWQAALAGFEVVPVEYPGRGSRFSAPFASSVQALAAELAEAISLRLGQDDGEFRFFGHSLGALMAYEVCLQLRRLGVRLPQQLWVSARKAPHLPQATSPRHLLPDAELVQLLSRMGGTPQTVLDNAEFRQLLLPVVRADFRLHDEYQHQGAAALACPVIALGGEEDYEVPGEAIAPWQDFTTEGFVQHQRPGGHFYLQQADFLPWFQARLSQA